MNDFGVKSSSGLIFNSRPIGFPSKDPKEIRKQLKDYQKILKSSKRKKEKEKHQISLELSSALTHEARQRELISIWREQILPNWDSVRHSEAVRQIWWEGIPSAVRSEVWCRSIRNDLQLSDDLYEISLDQMHKRMGSSDLSASCSSSVASANGKTSQNSQLVRTHNSKCESHTNINNNGSDEAEQNGESNTRQADKFDWPNCDLNATLTSGLEAASLDDKTVNLANHSQQNQNQTNHKKASQKNGEQFFNDCDRALNLRTIRLDVSRTFPQLCVFQQGGPEHDRLHHFLAASACLQPALGYVQGMSFLAAVLLLVIGCPARAFRAFVNILNAPLHHALYSLQPIRMQPHMDAFALLLAAHLPRVFRHFRDAQPELQLDVFLYDWLFTIYSRALPLDTALRVWDAYCRDGESALYRAGLAILKCFQTELLRMEFDELAAFLTAPLPPHEIGPDVLVREMREIKLKPKHLSAALSEAMSSSNALCTSSSSPLSSCLYDGRAAAASSNPDSPTPPLPVSPLATNQIAPTATEAAAAANHSAFVGLPNSRSNSPHCARKHNPPSSSCASLDSAGSSSLLSSSGCSSHNSLPPLPSLPPSNNNNKDNTSLAAAAAAGVTSLQQLNPSSLLNSSQFLHF